MLKLVGADSNPLLAVVLGVALLAAGLAIGAVGSMVAGAAVLLLGVARMADR